MFISPAYAQAAGGGGDMIASFLPLILIVAVFYFLLIRPQQKRMKEHKAKIAAMRRGDKIVTGGGIIGTITKIIDDNEAQVEIADGVRVRVAKSTVSDVLTKTEPAAADKGDKSKDDKDSSDSDDGKKKSVFRRVTGG